MPYFPPDSGAAGFAKPRLPGRSRLARWLERRLPAVVVDHALALGWIWVGVWAAVALTEELTDIPGWVFGLATILIVLPSFIAAALCLWVTPRYRLFQTSSILSHFIARFMTVVFAFVAWTVSIVIGASISSLLQLISENKEKQVIGTGFHLMAAIIPVVAILLWLGLVMRCCWFLVRLRGWRARPVETELPPSFLAETPRVRQWAVALSHPGLLLTAGVVSAVGATLAVFAGASIDLNF